MTIQELQEIVNLEWVGDIKFALERKGYIEMGKHPTMKNAPLVSIIKTAHEEVTEQVRTKKEIIIGTIFTNALHYENYEIIWIEFLEIISKRNAIPKQVILYIKETPNEH